MGLRINHNISSLNAQRNVSTTDRRLAGSLERLSSGLRINRAADDPAGLVISEQQRAQIAGLEQALENSERAISMVQTAEGALSEVNSMLLSIRTLAIDSANAGINDAQALAANQAEIANALSTIDRISRDTQFGTKTLLDGTYDNTVSITDGTNDMDLRFSSSEMATGSSNVVTISSFTAATFTVNQGSLFGVTAAATPAVYGIGPGTATLNVAQASEAAEISGGVVNGGGGNAYQLSVDATFDLVLDGSTTVTVTVTAADTATNVNLSDLVTDVQSAIDTALAAEAGEVTVAQNSGGTGLMLYTEDHGSAATLSLLNLDAVATNELRLTGTAASGVNTIIELSGHANTITSIDQTGSSTSALSDGRGGTITVAFDGNGTQIGSTLVNITGASGAIEMGGTAVSFTVGQKVNVSNAAGDTVDITVGNRITAGGSENLIVVDNSLVFQVGANVDQTVKIGLPSVSTINLGQDVANDSGFRSLAEIDVTTWQGAQDAIRIVDAAIAGISSVRGEFGAFQRNTLERNLTNLRIAAENLTAAESVIRDTDFSVEAAEFSKQQILLQAGTSVLRNANELGQSVLELIR